MENNLFNPLTAPITGTNLIEACAGTGKTYSISALCVRLIILENIEIEKILIVTFTKDSVAELKMRLRTNLLNILQYLVNENLKAEDIFTKELINALVYKQKLNAILKIKETLTNFDNINIFTIHGFCLKILSNYPHLCNYPNQINLTANKNANLILQIAQDFWRKNILNNNLLFSLFFEKEIKIQKMLNSIVQYLNKPYLKYEKPLILVSDLQKINNSITIQLNDIKKNINNLQQSLGQIITYLNKTKFSQNKLNQLFQCIQEHKPINNYIDVLIKFDKQYIINSINKQYKSQQISDTIFYNLNKFYVLGKTLQDKDNLTQNIILNIKFSLLEYINLQLYNIKNNNCNRTYDDLLLDVYSNISQGNNSKILINALKNNWQVVLIDEFQDTDQLQYSIFKKIFIDNQITTFLVGDPKQAIYKFRGADIFTYLNSIKDIDNFYTLSINYRSHKNLIDGINFLFNQKKLPFALKNVSYTIINAYKQKSDFLSTEADMNIISLNDYANNNKIDELKKIAAIKCAEHINYLLKNNKLKNSEIAILVSKHDEAALITSALKKLEINSITINKKTIFKSDEAYAINSMLKFWLNPQCISNLSFLLTSSIFNYDESLLSEVLNNKLDDFIAIAKNSKNILAEQGFYSAFNFFEKKLNIFSNLLLLQKERTLTNINHLIEIISHQELINDNYNLTIQWFQNNIFQYQKDSILNQQKSEDRYLLKLESDEESIKIVTIHSAKGLQYPIVFCPFLWSLNSKNPNNSDLNIIHKDNQTLLISNIQCTEQDKQIINNENLSEKLRLIYVALTRAKEKLYIYIYTKDTKNNENNSNPFKYLLENNIIDNNYSWSTWKNWYTKINSPKFIKLYENIQSVISSSNYLNNTTNSINLNSISLKPPLQFKRKHLYSILKTSFSSIMKTTNLHEISYDKNDLIIDANEIQYDDNQENLNTENKIIDIFSFPKGINTGLCWHVILEQFNFAQDAKEQVNLIQNNLIDYGLTNNAYLDVTINMLNNLRLCKLDTKTQLCKIVNLLPEVKFILKINKLDLNIIKQWLLQQNIFKNTKIEEYITIINLKSIECFLEGFIDLIFIDKNKNLYLIDYKSNHLGNNIQEYSLNNLTNSILKNHYYLQALIYTLSLYRYLLYNEFKFTHINIRYIFLRGIDHKYKSNGIWSWNLKKDDLNILNSKLSNKK